MKRWLGCAAFSLLGVACQPKLPGPLECENMTHAALGVTLQANPHAAEVQHLAQRLTHGCLTVPFDRVTLSCVAQGHNLPSCADDLARRHPRRKAALESLLSDMHELSSGRRGR